MGMSLNRCDIYGIVGSRVLLLSISFDSSVVVDINQHYAKDISDGISK
jgi:hypothetical protein